MEGRTIARPNDGESPQAIASLQERPFNGGPDNCPAKLRWRAIPRSRRSKTGFPSMEGRTIARPNPALGSPGPRAVHSQPSMEGRTIARPNIFECPPPWSCPSVPRAFNGGPDNCPAKLPKRCGTYSPRFAFNGGPDNCPAKPRNLTWNYACATYLQWRAGQLPGQTMRLGGDVHRRRKLSLQWRAGQLPGQTPNARGLATATVLAAYALQWRAGQLPGQTRSAIVDRQRFGGRSPFNGGPDNCPAKPGMGMDPSPNAFSNPDRPSMEGRTIARPNSLIPH